MEPRPEGRLKISRRLFEGRVKRRGRAALRGPRKLREMKPGFSPCGNAAN
jgi:hypothetical protein